MAKLWTSLEVSSALESQTGCRIWDIATIAEGEAIENTNYKVIYVYVTRQKSDVTWIRDFLSNVLNVVEIKYTGGATAAKV